MTKHNSLTAIVPATILVVLGVLAASAPVQAADISLRYGGQGVWRQAATANSQRWFRCEVTWNTEINDDGVPTERIDGLYLYGVSYSGMEAAPSGETYANELTGEGGIWDAGRRSETMPPVPVTILDIVEPGRTKFYYSATRYGQPYTYPWGSLAGQQLTITPALTGVAEQFTVLSNGSDYQGYYIIVDSALSVDVCRELSVWAKPSATRVYYQGADLTTVQYPWGVLAGRTLRFTQGVAAGRNFPIATNANDTYGYYIDIVAAEDEEDNLLESRLSFEAVFYLKVLRVRLDMALRRLTSSQILYWLPR